MKKLTDKWEKPQKEQERSECRDRGSPLSGSQVAGAMPADTGQEAGHILKKLPVRHAQRQTTIHSHFRLTNILACMSLGGSRSTWKESMQT